MLVKANGSKLWKSKYRYRGKEQLLSIGAYPKIGISAARERKIIAKGSRHVECDWAAWWHPSSLKLPQSSQLICPRLLSLQARCASIPTHQCLLSRAVASCKL